MKCGIMLKEHSLLVGTVSKFRNIDVWALCNKTP